jgi:hypothetical protein
MSNGYAEAKRLPLGLGDVFINNIFVGTLKGKVTFHDKTTYAEQVPGNLLAPVKAERIKQEVTLEAEVCDFKIAQLRRAIGINEAVDATAVSIRKKQQIKLSTTVNVTTTETMVAATLKVSKMDRSTVYLSGTDYSATSTTLARKNAGAITAGQTVLVEYNFSDSGSKSILVGGEQLTPNTFELDFVHDLSDGKIVQITLWKCYSSMDFSWVFNEKQSGNFSTYNVTFKALIDLTKKEGQNLYRITEEDGNATVN